MIRLSSPIRAVWAAFLLLACAFAMPAYAESLSKVETKALPGIATDQPLLGLLAVEGRPLAFTGQQAWMLDTAGKQWALSSWNPSGAAGTAIKGTAGSAGRQQRGGSANRRSRQQIGHDDSATTNRPGETQLQSLGRERDA